MKQEQELHRMGELVKLRISTEDEKLKEDLSKMIAYIDVIRQADTTELEVGQKECDMLKHDITAGEATGQAKYMTAECCQNVFREDELTLEAERFTREDLLQNAPQTAEGYFVVPKTVGE